MGSCTLFFIFLMSKYPRWLAHKRKLIELIKKKNKPEWVNGGTCLYKRIENLTERNLVIVWFTRQRVCWSIWCFLMLSMYACARTHTHSLRHGICYCKLQKGGHIHCHRLNETSQSVNNSGSNFKETLGRCSRKSHMNRNMLFFWLF